MLVTTTSITRLTSNLANAVLPIDLMVSVALECTDGPQCRTAMTTRPTRH